MQVWTTIRWPPFRATAFLCLLHLLDPTALRAQALPPGCSGLLELGSIALTNILGEIAIWNPGCTADRVLTAATRSYTGKVYLNDKAFPSGGATAEALLRNGAIVSIVNSPEEFGAARLAASGGVAKKVYDIGRSLFASLPATPPTAPGQTASVVARERDECLVSGTRPGTLSASPTLPEGIQYWTGTAPHVSLVFVGTALCYAVIDSAGRTVDVRPIEHVGSHVIRNVNVRLDDGTKIEVVEDELKLRKVRWTIEWRETVPKPDWLDDPSQQTEIGRLLWTLWLFSQDEPRWSLEALSRLAAQADTNPIARQMMDHLATDYEMRNAATK